MFESLEPLSRQAIRRIVAKKAQLVEEAVKRGENPRHAQLDFQDMFESYLTNFDLVEQNRILKIFAEESEAYLLQMTSEIEEMQSEISPIETGAPLDDQIRASLRALAILHAKVLHEKGMLEDNIALNEADNEAKQRLIDYTNTLNGKYIRPGYDFYIIEFEAESNRLLAPLAAKTAALEREADEIAGRLDRYNENATQFGTILGVIVLAVVIMIILGYSARFVFP